MLGTVVAGDDGRVDGVVVTVSVEAGATASGHNCVLPRMLSRMPTLRISINRLKRCREAGRRVGQSD